ncbi:MAG: ImmA/IrrE family metallo-endopeptidase [Desulfosudaceae bacterium]
MRVPFLAKTELAAAADALLTGYEEMTGRPVAPPVPVEEIIENFLGLRCGYVDFDSQEGMAGVLGATYVPKKLILINQNLVGEGKEGRAAFTMDHEAGHWQLHRAYVGKLTRAGDGPAAIDQTILCRSQDAKKPIEWQADYFAGCLLLPEKHVRSAFRRTFAPEAIDIVNVQEDFVSSPQWFDPCVDNWPLLAGAVKETGGFDNVSGQAMIIRLQELGLVVNHTGTAMGWHRHHSL